MKFLADENLGLEVVRGLRNLGFDVKSILETTPGASDIKVLSHANKEARILITTDKDFGELVFSKKLIHQGIVLLRLRKESSENKLKVLRALLEKHLDELENAFIVTTEGRVRIGKKRKLKE